MTLFHSLPDFSMLAIIANRMFKQILPRKKNTSVLPELGDQLIPPGSASDVFNGFVTSPGNAHGLQLKIHHDAVSGVSCHWLTAKKFEGYPQALHGGISFAILDELLAYAVFDRFRTFAVTLSSKTQFFSRIRVGEEVKANAVVTRKFWRFINVEGKIYNSRGRVVVSMKSTFYMPTKKEFKKILDLSIMPSEALPYCGTD
ncbi:PaaI family thioesterase [Marinagarivorans algicola]|uniref:PaaI family thioesterase n=1 Tax=Marinagarivorans algicola TaxID=1513270 RepID=UPI0006B647F6|nr:PaaI family thioesterase [Marinagarivorans algicola]